MSSRRFRAGAARRPGSAPALSLSTWGTASSSISATRAPHEDEAERSARAGLDIVDAMTELNAAVPRPSGVELAVRIGIATGPVIVGDHIGEGMASETAVVGETPNLASRLQALAQPNQILVSSATRAMLGDHFDLADLGAYEVKGFARAGAGLACAVGAGCRERVCRNKDRELRAPRRVPGGDGAAIARLGWQLPRPRPGRADPRRSRARRVPPGGRIA